MIARSLRIIGRVQGVFYRAATVEKAHALGVTGWIRNTDDDAVEAHVEGDEDVVAALIEWCKKGPPAARVENVEVTDAIPGGFSSFEIRRD